MHRTLLLRLLHEYNPVDPEELIDKNKVIAFVEDNPQCFERSLEIGHVTASAWLIDKTGSHALLTHHKKLNRWLQLGGHCDGDPDVIGVAIKEAQEESGINEIVAVSQGIFDLGVHDIPAYGNIAAHTHYDVRFLLQVTSDEPCIVSSESKALRWVSQDPELLPTHNPSIIRMCTKWQKTLRVH